MATSSSDDDASETWGARGSPPLRFGCFGPSCWKRRRGQAASSAAAEGDAAAAASGDSSREEPHVHLQLAAPTHSVSAASEASGRLPRREEKTMPRELNAADAAAAAASGDSGREEPHVHLQLSAPTDSVSAASEASGRLPTELNAAAAAGKSEVPSSRSTALTTTGVTKSWDDCPLFLDHEVLSHLPSYYDRCRMRCVCQRLRCATCLYPRPPQPLPLVIRADFAFLNFFADGLLSGPRQIKSPRQQMSARRTASVGSLDSWIVCAYPRVWDARLSVQLSDEECFVLNPSKQTVVILPPPPAFLIEGAYRRSVPVINGNSAFNYLTPVTAVEMTIRKVVLTESPDQRDCKYAAIADVRGRNHLAFCTAEMECWVLCQAAFVTIDIDLEFSDGHLYVLDGGSADLYVLDFGPKLCMFPVVQSIERCLMDRPPITNGAGMYSCNLVQSRKTLLLVIREFMQDGDQITGVTVYKLVKSPRPWSWSEITSLNGSCLLISSACSRDDVIYFLDNLVPGFLPVEAETFSYRMMVYNMRDTTIALREIGSELVRNAERFPMWFFPNE